LDCYKRRKQKTLATFVLEIILGLAAKCKTLQAETDQQTGQNDRPSKTRRRKDRRLKRLLASLAIFLGGLGLFLSIWWIGFNVMMRDKSHVSPPDEKPIDLAGGAVFAASVFSLRFGIKSLRQK
jgi:hypothetical protein